MISFHNQNENLLITGSWDGTIHVLDHTQGKRLKKFSGMGRIPCAYMHGNYILAGSYDKDLNPELYNRGRLIDYQTGQVLHFFNHGASIGNECVDIAFIPPQIIITSSDDGRIKKWRIDTENQYPEFLGEFLPMNGSVRKLTLSLDFKLLAAASGDYSFRIYDVGTLTLLKEFNHSHSNDVMDVKFSNNQKFIYSGSYDKTIKKWDISTGNMIFELSDPKDWVWKLCLFQDILIAGSADGHIYFYDEVTGKLLCTYYNLKDVSSFLLTSPPDYLHPKGSFYTNNPELIEVTRKINNNSDIVSVDEKNFYFKKHNNPLILQKILNSKSVEEKINSIQNNMEKNQLRFIFPSSKQLGSNPDQIFLNKVGEE